MVSNDVRCRCDGIAMLKATSQIRHIAVALNAQAKTKQKTATYGVGSRDNGLAHAVTCGRLLRLMPICNGIRFIELRSFITTY